MASPKFLSFDEILYIHEQEIRYAGGEPNVRDENGIKACVEAPKASFDEEYLNDIFEMAATYIVYLAMRHPFVDGNKRTALASALTFLYLNDYEIEETYELELADLVLDFIAKKHSKDDIAEYFRNNIINS